MRNLERQRDYFDRNRDEATKLLGVGEKKPDARFDAIELAAYSATASLILNLDEVMGVMNIEGAVVPPSGGIEPFQDSG